MQLVLIKYLYVFHCQRGAYVLEEGWAVLRRMRGLGVPPDIDTYTQLRPPPAARTGCRSRAPLASAAAPPAARTGIRQQRPLAAAAAPAASRASRPPAASRPREVRGACVFARKSTQ